jgi:signal peptidase II
MKRSGIEPVNAVKTPGLAEKMLSHGFFMSSFVLSLVLDQVTKHLVQTGMRLYDSIPVLGDFFRISYIRNPGIGFGLFANSTSQVPKLILLFFSLCAVCFVLYIYIRSGRSLLDQLSIGFILGGAFGNIYDRVVYGSVVDFFDFGTGTSRWYTFNIADMAILTGILLLFIQLYREERVRKKTETAGTRPEEKN